MGTNRDGELICPQCKTLLNTSDRLCWRCGGTNLQPGPNAKKAEADAIIEAFRSAAAKGELKWPVDANGTPLPADQNASCVCTPYYKCAFHAEKDAAMANQLVDDGSNITSIYKPKPSPFGVDPAWVESVRKGMKTASETEMLRWGQRIYEAHTILVEELARRRGL